MNVKRQTPITRWIVSAVVVLVAVIAIAVISIIAVSGQGDDRTTPSPSVTPTIGTDGTDADDTAISTVPATALTADDVLSVLSDFIADPVVVTEDTDPNDLLGRPGGYAERVTFALPGANHTGDRYTTERGGAIEVYSDADDAERRVQYIQDLLSDNPIFGTEYTWTHGNVVIRIHQSVAPSLVTEIETAVAVV